MLSVLPARQMSPQLAHGFVLFVTDSLRGNPQVAGDLVDRVALKTPLQDLPLPVAEQLGRGLPDGFPVVAETQLLRLVPVGDVLDAAGRPGFGPLRALLDRINRPQEFPAFLPLGRQHAVPRVRRDPLDESRKYFLRA